MDREILANLRIIDPVLGIDEKHGSARYVITPGLRDVHVHFRDPGMPEAETRRTGAKAACAGGFTCVTTMPNTTPAGDSVGWIREQIEDASLACRIEPSACISKGRLGKEVADLELLASAGAVCFTDDGTFVDNSSVMREAMERAAALGMVLMQHAVVPSIQKGGVMYAGPVQRKFGLPAMPPEAEIEAVKRDIGLARETGCALHIQHVTTEGAVRLIASAQKEGLKVTGEATPHHLLLSSEDIPANDANWKMAPPLGQPSDRKAIREAVKNGTLSLFATDHAPHPAAKKVGGFVGTANGIVGLETAAAITWQAMVIEEGMSAVEWARRWTTGPADLLGRAHEVQSIAPIAEAMMNGGDVPDWADFAIFDSEANWTVDPSAFVSRSRNQPFSGMKFALKPIHTHMGLGIERH